MQLESYYFPKLHELIGLPDGNSVFTIRRELIFAHCYLNKRDAPSAKQIKLFQRLFAWSDKGYKGLTVAFNYK